MLAMSSADDSWRSGDLDWIAASHARCEISGGRMVGPGAMQLTRMPSGATSAASPRVMKCMAALDVKYGR